MWGKRAQASISARSTSPQSPPPDDRHSSSAGGSCGRASACATSATAPIHRCSRTAHPARGARDNSGSASGKHLPHSCGSSATSSTRPAASRHLLPGGRSRAHLLRRCARRAGRHPPRGEHPEDRPVAARAVLRLPERQSATDRDPRRLYCRGRLDHHLQRLRAAADERTTAADGPLHRLRHTASPRRKRRRKHLLARLLWRVWPRRRRAHHAPAPDCIWAIGKIPPLIHLPLRHSSVERSK